MLETISTANIHRKRSATDGTFVYENVKAENFKVFRIPTLSRTNNCAEPHVPQTRTTLNTLT